ncbi:MAG: kinase [Candidatus Lindowbacteria bacterium RIFCSPLOWO2_12_FULL_62_27]|nr:MAG: kinase [Candidatus Lindowbacteria bacterium RIFCSPLOWO2_02_FULL_62_12]OGH62748.1 MAG: kinase [Candidatus Lindowbacteria bacterium RIFCSPLOWO2_12_FULL_62_27]
MIISKTPYRISFFGGGTDYPAWYRKEEGAVLSTTIDKYCHITCRHLPPFFNHKHHVVWSHNETVSSISEILHPAVREGLRYMGFDDSVGLEISHQGDLPARTGIGSSSAFTVGLILALSALRGRTMDKRELALRAIELEQDVIKESVGSQDQAAAAFGGFNHIRFSKDGVFAVDPTDVPQHRVEQLESRLMLLFTGTSRLSTDVASLIVQNLKNRTATLRRMRDLVDRAVALLKGKTSLDEFGELLHEGWQLKRNLAGPVTNPTIDAVYQTAREAGALGGKLLGAGAAGFMVFYVPPDRQDPVRQALPNYLWVPFAFESDGAKIIHNSSFPEIPPEVAAPEAAGAAVRAAG